MQRSLPAKDFCGGRSLSGVSAEQNMGLIVPWWLLPLDFTGVEKVVVLAQPNPYLNESITTSKGRRRLLCLE